MHRVYQQMWGFPGNSSCCFALSWIFLASLYMCQSAISLHYVENTGSQKFWFVYWLSQSCFLFEARINCIFLQMQLMNYRWINITIFGVLANFRVTWNLNCGRWPEPFNQTLQLQQCTNYFVVFFWYIQFRSLVVLWREPSVQLTFVVSNWLIIGKSAIIFESSPPSFVETV